METRVAVMSIIVENTESVEPINTLLHEHGQYIIGRMGIPYRQRGISVISIAVDAPQDKISALRKASNEYMDDALRRTEEAIAQSLNEVRDTRTKFLALTEAQEAKAAGDYSGAMKYYEQLGDYQDSKEQYLVCFPAACEVIKQLIENGRKQRAAEDCCPELCICD